MKSNLTELVFILDRSGSMAGLEDDTIGGFNAMLEKQKKEAGEAIVTTVLFDDKYEILHDRINIKGVNPVNNQEYYVRGCTALLDALGKTISKINSAQKNTTEDEKAAKVMFVITTDGFENASHEFSYDKVKSMIEHQKKEYGWEFIFLGANIDAVETASRFGISADRAANYHSDGKGTQLNYKTVSETVSCFRANQQIDKDWKRSIDDDFSSRNGHNPKK